MRGARATVTLAIALAACTDQSPISAPGTLTAVLVSPYGAEGAAVVTLVGEGIGETTAVGDVQLFRSDADGKTTLVLVSPSGGTLSFGLAVADTTRLPVVSVTQVAGPDDELRSSAATAYRVELVR